MKGAFSGDFHYGLHVEEFDRTKEVDEAVNFIIDYVIENDIEFLSIGGDLLHNNNPHPDYIALLIKALNRLEEAEIPTFILKGNHCAIASAGKLWALTPLEQIGYNNVIFITKPDLFTYNEQYFIFLPHITKSQAIELGYSSAQECVDGEAQKLVDQIPADHKAIVVAHYNINGAKAGTEKLMLRQSDLQLPGIVQRSPKVCWIVNSHIHTAGFHGDKIVMPGSPICTDFGDLEVAKGFAIGEKETDEWNFTQIPTPQAPMQQFEVDLLGMEAKEIEKALCDCVELVVRDSIVKARVIIEEEKLPYVDFPEFKAALAGRARFVKDIDKMITKKRLVRDVEQKPNLSPSAAVDQYIKKLGPEGAERKLDLAKKILSGEQLTIQETEGKFENPTAASEDFNETMGDLEDLAKEEVIIEGQAVEFDEVNDNNEIITPDSIDFGDLEIGL